ncbi:MAG: nusG [Chlamydiales bacterium]|jgi:transcriptional antiterminator NusG|nr:nusG [Chlamydiales bacterium]
MNHKWYVVQVLSTHEKKVKKNLEEYRDTKGMTDFITEILIPTENVYEVKRGEQKITERRLWPGYILLKMVLNDESWTYVKNTVGVIDFLGGDKPTPLTDDEVKETLHDLESKKQKVTQKHQFQVGDKVKINDGVFMNFVGTVTDVFHDKGRLSVTVSIFGRDTRVDDLEFWQVEHYTGDAAGSE